jgi:hypothetical protein
VCAATPSEMDSSNLCISMSPDLEGRNMYACVPLYIRMHIIHACMHTLLLHTRDKDFLSKPEQFADGAAGFCGSCVGALISFLE